MTSLFAFTLPIPPHSRPAPGVGVGLPVFLVWSRNNSPPVPARCGLRCRSPQRGLGSCAPPGRRLPSPSLTRLGAGKAGLRRVRERHPKGLRDKHMEMPREPGRDAHRKIQRQRQTGCRDIFRETQREGQAALHPETWRTPEGCASHVHTGAYTGPHSLHRDTLYLRLRCADSLQQSRVTTSLEGRGSASAHHARKGMSCVYDGGSLWPVVANPLLPGRSAEP